MFRSYMPAEISIGVMMRVPLTGIPIDPYIPNHYKGQMQIIIRHREPALGIAMANEVQKLLKVESREFYPANQERGEVNLDIFIPETLPISFPRLNGNGHEWSQHFRCVFTMLPL